MLPSIAPRTAVERPWLVVTAPGTDVEDVVEAADPLDVAEAVVGFPEEGDEVDVGVEVNGDVVATDGGGVIEGVAVGFPVVVDGGGVKPP